MSTVWAVLIVLFLGLIGIVLLWIFLEVTMWMIQTTKMWLELRHHNKIMKRRDDSR